MKSLFCLPGAALLPTACFKDGPLNAGCDVPEATAGVVHPRDASFHEGGDVYARPTAPRAEETILSCKP